MCLMLYVATAGDQPCFETLTLNVEGVEPSREAVRRWFTLPVVRFVGAHTGCSCGFRSVRAEQPIDYEAGMFDYEADRGDAANRQASMLALIEMVRGFVARDGIVELLPLWDGDEGEVPKGTLERDVDALDPSTWFFVEGFMYRVGRGANIP